MASWNIAPYFIVADVVATANFYRDKLGFHYERFWGDPPAFCIVRRAGIMIMLSQLFQPQAACIPIASPIRAVTLGTLIFGWTTPSYSTKSSWKRE